MMIVDDNAEETYFLRRARGENGKIFFYPNFQESSFKVVSRMFYTIGHCYQPSVSWWLDTFPSSTVILILNY